MSINVVFISYHFHVKSRCGGSYPIPRSSPWTQQEYSEKMVVGGLGWEKSIASVESVSGNEIVEVGQCQHGQLGYNSFLIRDQLTHLHWIRMDERSATFAWKYIKSYEIDVHGKQIGNVCMKLHNVIKTMFMGNTLGREFGPAGLEPPPYASVYVLLWESGTDIDGWSWSFSGSKTESRDEQCRATILFRSQVGSDNIFHLAQFPWIG